MAIGRDRKEFSGGTRTRIFSVGVTGGRLGDSSLVGPDTGIAESVLAVALLEMTAVFDGH